MKHAVEAAWLERGNTPQFSVIHRDKAARIIRSNRNTGQVRVWRIGAETHMMGCGVYFVIRPARLELPAIKTEAAPVHFIGDPESPWRRD